MSNLSIENLSGVMNSGNLEFNTSSASSIAPVRSPALPQETLQPGDTGKSFSDILKDSVDKVNIHQNQADKAIKELVAGRSKNIHETMLTVERADTSLKLMMQVRNKILDAYKEIMRMQV